MTRMTDLQIVNGGQTTASLFYVAREKQGRPARRRLRPDETRRRRPGRDGSRNGAAHLRYANSQNRVSEADFFSNSPFHVRLAELSHASWFRRSQASTSRRSGSTSAPAASPEREEKRSPAEQRKFEAEYPRAR